ncbi:hypothetical protein C7E20_13175 [Sphingobium sp. AEW4]|nr:hypothetical protein C7E20_13175 [Sphingobium sp. AEW4]
MLFACIFAICVAAQQRGHDGSIAIGSVIVRNLGGWNSRNRITDRPMRVCAKLEASLFTRVVS